MKPLNGLSIFLLCLPALGAPNKVTPVALENFQLLGEVSGGQAAFTLRATARVEQAGERLSILSGPVALMDLRPEPKWHLQAEPGGFELCFDHSGRFPVELKFQAAVRPVDGWNAVSFQVAPGALQAIRLRGLGPEAQLEMTDAARPERHGTEFTSFLAGNGLVNFRWKDSPPEGEGKLFYAAEMLSQVSISPGLLQQEALLEFKVMQGELKTLTVRLHGEGEVTRVQGEQILSWTITRLPDSNDRQLVVEFNQPQKDRFGLQIHGQTPLGAFPQSMEVLRFQPQAATRFAGFIRIENEGAVRLDVARAVGLSQISPEQFPETENTHALPRPTATQRLVYRFSDGGFTLQIRADQIQPELTISEWLNYHFGENDLAIEGELGLEIRDAPVRELTLEVPRDYLIAAVTAADLSDYFVADSAKQATSELRLIFGRPVSGRQVLRLRLERNKPPNADHWSLPRIEVPRAKTIRGHVATSVDPGFRLTPERTSGLTEIATAFFPRKLAGIQSAFRLTQADWQASVRVERLPQTVQADALHLFSIGEGVAYGSSLLNYSISGAPVASFRVELSEEYYNVEFTGKDIRNWQRIAGGYQVQLHTPVSGPYTLLATYERPFKPQGETLAFTGAHALDAQSEQGHTLVISAYQFQVKPVQVSTGLVPVEPAEIPGEYRLFFDAPILAAYRYLARPYDLRLALSPLAQGESLSLVVDRASLTTRISKEGQLVTQARYFVKDRGNPRLRISLPEGARLWSASVNGNPVVPVTDTSSSLIPLPGSTTPNELVRLDLTMASVAKDPKRFEVFAPVVQAPVMLAEWRLVPESGRRLEYRGGALAPSGPAHDNSGYAQLLRTFGKNRAGRPTAALLAVFSLIVLALVAWYWGGGAACRLNSRHVAGLVLGGGALLTAAWLLFELADTLQQHHGQESRELSFTAPVQQAGGALSVEVLNREDKISARDVVSAAWPAVAALLVWLGTRGARHSLGRSLGMTAAWLLLAWTALRLENGGTLFLALMAAFLVLHLAVPVLVRWWRLPPVRSGVMPSQASAAGAGAASLLALLVWSGSGRAVAVAHQLPPTIEGAVPELVSQQIRIQDKFALAVATIRWRAEKNQTLPLLFSPAVLTGLQYPSDTLELEHCALTAQAGAHPATNEPPAERLRAKKRGLFDLELRYQLPVIQRGEESGFWLAVPAGLVNRLDLTLSNQDVEVSSPVAISVHHETAGSNTVAHLLLPAGGRSWISWKPRTRDLAQEKPVWYATLSQLYAPAAGAIEGVHRVSVRVAQGELRELVMEVPAGLTITDVAAPAPAQQSGSIMSVWRFDPDTRRLRVRLNPAQARPFTLLVRSQVAAGPLPFTRDLGVIRVLDAAEQLGLTGLATGNELQLDNVTARGMSPINLEDFPADLLTNGQTQVAGATVRRAFRYEDSAANLTVTASAVQPEVRAESRDTVSLGEDRTVLAVDTEVTITRAGIFGLSFQLPLGFEVESISGAALSQWTESGLETNRLVRLHFNGKTQGQQKFSLSLAGPGVRATNGWLAPQLVFREAAKQSGTLLLVPEQGLRLQVVSADGLTQLDPQQAGIKEKGVLALRALRPERRLVLSIQEVDPWIQVSTLQQISIGEAEVKLAVNLQYQVENAGLKRFQLLLPTNAQSVQFAGEQVSDFLALPGAITNGLQVWEVRLQRRVIGALRLQLSYQQPGIQSTNALSVRGVRAVGVNVQRGFVTVLAGGRLQVRSDSVPAALQPAEWQSIPRGLQQDLPAPAANFTYRLIDPDFELPLRVDRYQPAPLLSGRILSLAMTSVISDEGVMLTQARLEMQLGEKRLLRLTLPANAHFWFAFVNQAGVWPWREGDQILIPLEQTAQGDKPVPVEVFYTGKIGQADHGSLRFALEAPKFELPLENITWRVSLSDKWELKNWAGTLQLQNQQVLPGMAALDLGKYLEDETLQQTQRTKKAEEFLAAANSALAQGEPQEARRAFQSAYGLSTHDAAFNEDARVQLHNIKLQEALVGLNMRQAGAGGKDNLLGGKLRALREREMARYSQQDARDLIERNSSEENAAFIRLAERLVQQQDAAVTAPAALHASIPEQGRILTFTRSVLVNPWSALGVEVRAATATTKVGQAALLGSTALLLFAAICFGRPLLSGRETRAKCINELHHAPYVVVVGFPVMRLGRHLRRAVGADGVQPNAVFGVGLKLLDERQEFVQSGRIGGIGLMF